MRKPLVAGNWKMHGSRVENAALVRGLLDALKPEWPAEVLVCPPHVYLWETGRRMPQVPQLRKLGQLFGICSDEIVLSEPANAPHAEAVQRS